jgi:hypothetical protein
MVFFSFTVSLSWYICKYFIYAHLQNMAFHTKIFMILKNAHKHNMQNHKQSRAVTMPIFMKFTTTQ